MRVSEGFRDATYLDGVTLLDQIDVNDFPEDVVREILNFKDEDDDNGRSQTVAIRLPNGDLVLGFFPQGDTYEYVTQHWYV